MDEGYKCLQNAEFACANAKCKEIHQVEESMETRWLRGDVSKVMISIVDNAPVLRSDVGMCCIQGKWWW